MVLDLLFFLVFVLSAFSLWYRISLKIPQLTAIPDQVIADRFYEDSAKIRLFLMHFKAWYEEKRHIVFFWKFFAKTLYKIHILLLRLDNTLVAWFKKSRGDTFLENGGISNGSGNGTNDYWSKLQNNDKINPALTSKSGVKMLSQDSVESRTEKTHEGIDGIHSKNQ